MTARLRMAGNYAAVGLAWRYLCEFAGTDPSEGDFPRDLTAEMNSVHIAETSADREPSGTGFSKPVAVRNHDGGNYKHAVHVRSTVDGEFCILLRTGHVMDHIAHTGALRDKWNGLPVKSDRVFKRQLHHSWCRGRRQRSRTAYLYPPRAVSHTRFTQSPCGFRSARMSVREDLATDALEQRGRA